MRVLQDARSKCDLPIKCCFIRYDSSEGTASQKYRKRGDESSCFIRYDPSEGLRSTLWWYNHVSSDDKSFDQ